MQYFPVFITSNNLVYPDGRIWSIKRNKFLKHTKDKHGYIFIGNHLTKIVGGSGSLHRILAHCFLGGIPSGMVIDHLDGDKENNELTNLEIVTPAENIRRAYEKGFAKGKPGEENSMAKLTDKDVELMCSHLLNGWDNEKIAKIFNVHPRYVSLIRHGKRWKKFYNFYGPFPESMKPHKYAKLYIEYLKIKDTHINKDIAKLLKVDPSTISRWRSGEHSHPVVQRLSKPQSKHQMV